MKIQPIESVKYGKGHMRRGKITVTSAYIGKTETSHINSLVMHFKLLEKLEQTKPETSRWREIIKIRAII
jgi:hypothetical protein